MLKDQVVTVKIDGFSRDGDKLKLELQGHNTVFRDKGKNGALEVTLHIVQETDRWCEGNDVFSKHHVCLSDALKGCEVTIPTVFGEY